MKRIDTEPEETLTFSNRNGLGPAVTGSMEGCSTVPFAKSDFFLTQNRAAIINGLSCAQPTIRTIDKDTPFQSSQQPQLQTSAGLSDRSLQSVSRSFFVAPTYLSPTQSIQTMLAEPAYLPSNVMPAAAATGPAFSPLWRIPYRFPASQVTPPQQAPPGVVAALYASQALAAPSILPDSAVRSDKGPGDAQPPEAKLAIPRVAATAGAEGRFSLGHHHHNPHSPAEVTYIPSASAMQWASFPTDNDALNASRGHQHQAIQPPSDVAAAPPRQTDTLHGSTTGLTAETHHVPSGRATSTRNSASSQPSFRTPSTFTTGAVTSGTSTPAWPTAGTPLQQESQTFQGLATLEASIPGITAAPETTSFSNTGADVESRYVILPGGMFARPKDVYVESLPGGAGRQTGGCLAMSLHDMLIRYDALDKHYYRLKEENAKLRVALFELYQRVPVTPISRNMVIMQCDSGTFTDEPKCDASPTTEHKTAVSDASRPLVGDCSTEASLPDSKSPISDGDGVQGSSPSATIENHGVENRGPAYAAQEKTTTALTRDKQEHSAGHRRSCSHTSQAQYGKPLRTNLPSRMGSDPLLPTSVSSSSSPIQKHNTKSSTTFTEFSPQNRKLTSRSPQQQRPSDRISRLPSEQGLRNKLLATRLRRSSAAAGSRRLV